jgi:gliding motility-associated-like protein
MEMFDFDTLSFSRKIRFHLLIGFFWLVPLSAFTQSSKFILEGSATQTRCDCYSITPAVTYAAGGAWNSEQVNLNQPFDLNFKLFLGCNDDFGGDGSAFVLQPTAKLGTAGEGLGFGYLNPSIAIAFDTWQNPHLNDPPFDHISIQKNGSTKHENDLASPIPLSATSNNVEDCNWHKLRITWDPATKWLRTYFDDVARVATQTDLVNDVFGGNPVVYWGFTGATGGAVNRQEFCILNEPFFDENLVDDATCIGNSIEFSNSSQSFFPIGEYRWDWGDGTASTEKNPSKVYTAPGNYTIKMSMTDVTGCVSKDYQKDILVLGKPDASFDIEDVCIANQPTILVQPNSFSKNIWYLNGNQFSTDSLPDLRKVRAGEHLLKRSVVSTLGCGSDEVERIFTLQQAIASAGKDSMVLANMPFQLNGNANGSIKWVPSIGLNNDAIANPTSTLMQSQMYTMEVVTSAGCTARDSVQFTVLNDATIFVPNAFTPNGDGRNDIFIPHYVGIKKLHYFSVFNRWGGLVFTTSNLDRGWNGVEKGNKSGVGTYVWIVSAEDINGRKIQQKGSVTKVL